MANQYIPRRSGSSSSRYRTLNSSGNSPQRGDYPPRNLSRRPLQKKRRKTGPPPIFILALLLLVAAIIAVLAVSLSRCSKKPADRTPPSSAPVSSSSSQPEDEPSSSSLAEPVSQPVSSSAPEVPPEEKIPEGAVEKLDSNLRIGDTGYEYYNFVESTANQYITLVSNVGKQLEGAATVYDIVIPTSMDIMLPESFLQGQAVNSSDQKRAIEYLYSSINVMNPSVKTVPIFDALKLHNNEYIYFRTDHHWTQLGAYYAYAEFCKAKGVEAVPLDQFDKREYPGFLGSFYSAQINSDMENHPDTVEAYLPAAQTSMYVIQADGTELENWPMINDGSDENYSAENKYLIFCAGDQPYEVITSSAVTDGSSCVVVKESFGNAFIPYLVNHYQTVYVTDYRYYTGNIAALVKEKGIKDVILVNNISMTRNEGLVDSLGNSF